MKRHNWPVVVGGMVVILMTTTALAQRDRSSRLPQERIDRAEKLIEGLDLSEEQRNGLLDRLLYPSQHFDDVPRPAQEADGALLSEAQLGEVETFLLDNRAVQRRDLDSMREENPQAYQGQMQRLWRGLQEAKRVSKRHPDRGERMERSMVLEIRTELLGREYEWADDRERVTIETELRQLLNDYFDLKTSMRRDEINRLRRELNRLEQQIKQREDERVAIIDRRLKVVTGQGDPLDP